MPIITEYINYECKGLLRRIGLRAPEKFAKKFHIPIDEIKLIEEENKNGQLSTFIQVPILNVMNYSPGSGEKFTFRCDECNKEVTMQINNFLSDHGKVIREIPKSLTDRTLCGSCKFMETMIERYGVPYAAQNPEIYAKVKKTNLERYNI